MIENVTNIILFNNRFLAPTPISLNGLVTALTMFKPICAILEYFFASLTITLLSIFFLVVSNVVICFTVSLFTSDNPFLFNKSSILWITYFANNIDSSILENIYKEYYYYDADGNTHKVSDSLPFVLHGHKLMVKFTIDGVVDTPNINKCSVKYKLV